MQPLFFEPVVEFEKSAAQTQLSEDPNAWPQELLQELYKQAPYVSDFSPHVVMEKVEGEQGYGLGHVEIGNQSEVQTATSPSSAAAAGLRTVRVPIVIKDGMLYPFDLLVTDDSKVLPLTEVRLRAAIFRPQAFDVTSRTPGDQSMIGQLYPPFRQSFGFGGSGVAMNVGMGKEGSALESYLEKSAGAFQDFGDQFLSPDYLHAEPGTTQARAGKKMASGEYRQGALNEFITKNKTAAVHIYDDPSLHADQETARKGHPAAGFVLGGAAGAGVGHYLSKGSHKGTAIGAGLGALGTTAAMLHHNAKVDKHRAEREKKGSVLEAILPTINESDLLAFKHAITDPDLAPVLYKNAAAVTPSIQLLLEAPERPKFASHFASLVRPSVVQLRRGESGYQLKTASHSLWAPAVEHVDRAEAVRRLGEKVVLAADLSGAVTMSDTEGVGALDDPEHDTDMQGAGPVTEAGLYKVQTPEGAEAVGYVIPNLIDIDGTALPLALFTNGTQAVVQGDIVGVPTEGADIDLPSADVPEGRGVFASEGPNGVQATIPLTISARVSMGEGEPTMYKAESFTGEDVLVSCQPNIQTVVGTEDGKMLIPDTWQWVPLGQADSIALESQEDGLGKAAALRRKFASVEVVSGGGGTYSLRGHLVEKLAHDEREMLSLDETMFLLAGLGVNQNYGVQKLSHAMTGEEPVRVRVGRTIKLAADEMTEATARAREVLAQLPQLRQQCFKEAAVMGDPTAVDTVLSLGFLNPENLMTFVGYLPSLEDTQAKLCDVLLASRLGNLLDTPEGSTERAVRSLEAVLEGLKALAFQQN